MQIHEITYKPLKEGFMAGAGAVLGAVGREIGKQAGASASARSGISIPDSNATSGDRQHAATAATAASVKPMAMAMQKSYAEILNSAVQNAQMPDGSPVANYTQLDDASKTKAKDQVKQMIVAMLGAGPTYDYTQILTNITDLDEKMRAKQNIDTITTEIAEILKLTDGPATTPDALSKAFLTLAQNGIAPMINQMAATKAAATGSRAGVAGGTGNTSADALMHTMGIDAADLATMKNTLTKSGEKVNPAGTGSPTLDALLKSAGLLTK